MVVRICIFFVGSIFLLACILPWNSKELGAIAYVGAFEQMGIGWAANVMNAVVLTAVLSCLNSGLYTASRMLFVLAARREAPTRLLEVTSARRPGRGDPVLDGDRLSCASSPPTSRPTPCSCSCSTPRARSSCSSTC